MHESDQAVCHAFCAKSRANPGWPIMLMLCEKKLRKLYSNSKINSTHKKWEFQNEEILFVSKNNF